MIGALILGLVAGGLARLVIPNDALEHLEGWKSWLATIVLGLVGALVGWLIFTGLFGIGDTDVFDLGGIIGAIIGSILVLVGVGWFLRRTGRRPARRPQPRNGLPTLRVYLNVGTEPGMREDFDARFQVQAVIVRQRYWVTGRAQTRSPRI